MGTMIQTHELDEAAFRGDRFRDHPSDLRGANDLLVLTRPDVIAGHPRRVPGRRRRRHLHQHLQRQRGLAWPTTAWSRIAGEMNLVAAQLARACRGRRGARGPGTARGSWRAPWGPRPGPLPCHRTSTTQGRAASPGTSWWRRTRTRRAAWSQGGADVLLIETIFDTLNAKAAIFAVEGRVRGAGLPAAGDDQRHHHGRLGPDPVGPDRGGVLGQRAPRAAAERRPQLRPGREAAAAVSPGAVGHRGRVRVGVPQRRACPTRSGATTRSRRRRRASCRSSWTRGSLNFVGGCCGTTPAHIRAIAAAAAGRPPRSGARRARGTRGCPAWSR